MIYHVTFDHPAVDIPHPVLGGDESLRRKFVEIDAASIAEAQRIAVDRIGQVWDQIWEPGSWARVAHRYDAGCAMSLSAEDVW